MSLNRWCAFLCFCWELSWVDEFVQDSGELSCVVWSFSLFSIIHSLFTHSKHHFQTIPFNSYVCGCLFKMNERNTQTTKTFPTKQNNSSIKTIKMKITPHHHRSSLPNRQYNHTLTPQFPLPTLQNIPNTTRKQQTQTQMTLLLRTIHMFSMWIWTLNKHNKSFIKTTTSS